MKRRLLKNSLFSKIAFLLLLLSFVAVALLFSILIYKSIPLLEYQSIWSTLSQSIWSPLRGDFGFLPFIMGTIWVTLLSLILAIPPCLLTSIYLVEYASDNLRNTLLPLINILAALPSVLYGVWGVLFAVPLISEYVAPIFHVTSTGYSVFTGGLVLSIMISPIMISIIVQVLKTIPQDLKVASLSLGATKWETIKKVNLKKAKVGIIAAIVLALSRALGETIAVLMVCGNIPKVPESLFDAGYPIPALIANNFGEMMSIPLYDSALMFAALLLFTIILAFNLIARIILTKLENK